MHGIVTTAVGATAGSTDSAYPLPAARDRNERAAGVTGAASGQPGNGQTASLGSSPGGGTRGTGIIFSYQVLTGRSYNIAYATFEQSGDTGAGGLTIQSPFDGSNPSQATPGTFNAGATMRGDAAGHPAGATGATRPGFAATIPDRTAPGSLPGAAFLETQDQTLGYSAQLLDGLAPSHWFSPTATTGTGGGTAFTTAHTLGCPMTPTGSSLVPAPGMVSASTPSAVGATAALTDVLYLQEAGDSSLISVYDINQGQIGDCFLLSSIGEIALWHPSAIMSMIQANANGTETVTLHLAANGSLPTFGTTSFETVSITVSNTFPSDAVNNGATQDVANGEKEIWVQVLEKAVATLGGGYDSIANGGNPMIAMEELTGQAATSMSPGSLTVQDLQSDMAAGDLIVMDTASSGSLPYGLYNDHAYMFESVTTVGGTPMVQLLNPWGFDEPSAIPLSQLSQGIVEVDIGQFVNNQDITGTSGNDTITLTYDLTNGSVNLGAGNDTLTLANGTNSATVINTETIIGGSGNDTITLGAATANASIDLGSGNDTLILGTFAHAATIANTETVTGGSGNDTVTLATALTTGMSVDLGGGANKLTLANVANTGSVGNVNTLIGGAGNDAITLGTAVVNGSIDLGAGSDSLTLANGTNAATVANTETIIGGTGNDSITLSTLLTGSMQVDLGAGANKLTLANGANTGTVGNVETLIGGTGADVITLRTVVTDGSVSLGSGANKLTLAAGGNTLTVSNVQSIVGGGGGDTVTLATAATDASINLAGGGSSVTFGNFTNIATVSNAETIAGGSGNDTITLGSALTDAMRIDLGAGKNTLTLGNVTNTGTVGNVDTLIGGTGADTIALATAMAGGSVNLGSGADTLTLGNFNDTATVSNVETIVGGTGNDSIVLSTGATNASISLGSGADTLTLSKSAMSGTIANVMTLTGTGGNDSITLGSALTTGMSVDLGSGANTLTLNNGSDTGTVKNVGTLLGGTGTDTITLGTVAKNASISLGAGNDTLIFGNFANTATVARTDTIIGAGGNDTITLGTALTDSMSVDLGGGSNKLTLASGANTGTVSNVDTLIGGTGTDSITLGTTLTNCSVSLGAGTDTLTLAGGTNRLSVANTETVQGGSGADTIVLTGSSASMVIGGGGLNFITGNTAADTFVFDQDSAGNDTTLMNFSTARGDKIALDTTGSAILAGNTYNLGGAALSVGHDLADVANATARLATTLNNGGNGAFVYEQDTGGLYYSSNGSFAGGGTLIGVVTTNGSTAWTFNASSFTQV